MTMKPKVLLYLMCGLFAGTTARAQVDLDHDGMSDVWELQFGNNFKAPYDTDGDGRIDQDESTAGTDAVDASSFLDLKKVEIVPGASGTLTDGTATFQWDSLEHKQYRIQVSFDLKSWSHATPWLDGEDGEMEKILDLAKSYRSGGAVEERWVAIPDNWSLSTLRTVPDSDPPDQKNELDRLDIEDTGTDDFGRRIRGWILPPADGSYTFWIAGDDESEFWLSTDAASANKVRIARATSWTDYQEWTKQAGQRSAPVSLLGGRPYYFEIYHRDWGWDDHISVAWTGPGLNADREIIDGKYLALGSTPLATEANQLGAIFFRVLVRDIDSDSDGVTDYEEACVGLDPANPTTTPRIPDLTAIGNMLAARNVVTVGTPIARAYESTATFARFTIFRSGNATELTIPYTLSGSAAAGTDYTGLSGVAHLPMGVNSVSIDIDPLSDMQLEPQETVTLRVEPGASYDVGNPAQATVTIDDEHEEHFVALLRPDPAARSGAYGVASLILAGNRQSAKVSLSFSNLTSAQVDTKIYVSTTGTSGPVVLTLPEGQVPSLPWNLEAAGGLAKEQIIQAFVDGRAWVRVNSTRFPNGELFGVFGYHEGWENMPPPPTAPPLPGGALTDAQAARFLTQATFGPTTAEIARLKAMGINAWLDEQFALPASLHLPYVQARRAEELAESGGDDDGWQGPRQEAWWQIAVTGQDQLRQRVALALSEIMVVSDIGVLDSSHEGITNYYDLLVTHAFGNYRNLLEEVTLSPIMGQYLSMIRNQKPNPETGSEPDENYAREVMQLFSIGLNQLHPDGSIKLGPGGRPIPTYTQLDIVGLAHVFTGWGPYYTGAPDEDEFIWGDIDEMKPMSFYPGFHDTGVKHIVGGVTVPAGQTGDQDMDLAMDTLFNHPNVGPFISRQLIQRLVTSNPSPGYIYRVALVFANNGSGVRGDLRAVVRAILTDYEARSGDMLADTGFGKLREPLLRVSHLLRACPALPPLASEGDNRLFLDLQYALDHQAALKSPSVFNFFQPGFIQPGRIAAAGLFSPEFQITSETTVVNQTNMQHIFLHWGMWTGEVDSNGDDASVHLDMSAEIALLNRQGFTRPQNQAALLDLLNFKLLSGQMTAGLRQKIQTAFTTLPNWFYNEEDASDQLARMAVYLIFASPEYSVQK